VLVITLKEAVALAFITFALLGLFFWWLGSFFGNVDDDE
jgi:hypothetical protein